MDHSAPHSDPDYGRIVGTGTRIGRHPSRERLRQMIESLDPDDAEASAWSDGEPLTDEIEDQVRPGPPWRWRLSLRPVVTLLVIAVLGAGALLLWGPPPSGSPQVSVLVSGTPQPFELPDPSGSATPGSSSAEGASAAPGADGGTGAAAGEELRVHVIGAVNQPGLVRLPAGSIVDDAIRAAGGPTEDAALEGVNLAGTLSNGTQILVPTRDQLADGSVQPPAAAGNTGNAAGGTGGAGGSDGSSGRAGGAGATEKINLNQATQEELEELPRVGPVLAERIIQWREQNGPFASVEELDAVPGIGPAMMSSLEPLVTV